MDYCRNSDCRSVLPDNWHRCPACGTTQTRSVWRWARVFAGEEAACGAATATPGGAAVETVTVNNAFGQAFNQALPVGRDAFDAGTSGELGFPGDLSPVELGDCRMTGR